jgi:sec-independent protein translocase protein TatA
MDPVSIAAQIEGMEWIVVLVIIAVLIFLLPTKLPALARSFGRAIGDFRKGRQEVEDEIRELKR